MAAIRARALCVLLAPLVVLGVSACSGQRPNLGSGQAAGTVSAASLFQRLNQSLGSSAAAATAMRRAGTLTFKEIYDHLLAHTSDRRVQVDGLILENSRSALLANEAQYQSLDGAFANLAAFWSFINFDALEFTPTADGFSQVTEALTQSTVKPSSLNLVTTTVCGMGIGNAIFKKLKGPSPKGARSSYMGNPNAPMKEPNPNAPYAPILGGACTIQHSQMGSQTGYSAYMLAGTMRQHGPEAMFDETELDDIAERGVDPNAFVNYLGGCFRGSDGQGTLGDELAAACESDAAS